MSVKRGRRPGYAAGLLGWTVGTFAAAAFALTVIFASQAVFPVDVFGPAGGGEVETPAVRGATAGEVWRGLVGDFRLPDALGGGGGEWVDPDPLLTEARRRASAGEWPGALALYGRLVEERPSARALAIERARVLSWAGRAAEAAAALRELTSDRPEDAPLLVEAASFYWWAGDAASADELLSRARGLGAEGAEVDSLRAQVRAAMTPDVAAAQRWVAEEPTWENRLTLARAYLAEQRWLAAVEEFDRALLAEEAPDSAYLEMAAAAAAADSVGLAVATLREYLGGHPDDQAARLSLARTLGWEESYGPAIAEYERYLSAVEDPTARFELAQLLTWTERNEEAARELRRVALATPRHAPTYRLLGDLARWSGDYELAIANYRYASDLAPGDAATRTALREAEREYERAAIAAMPLPMGACTVAFESFSDSEGFSWVETRGGRVWRGGWGALALEARQSLSQADHAFAPGGERFGGMSAAARLYLPVSRTATIDLLAGTTDYGDFGRFAQLGVGFEARDVAGSTLTARYTRQPALQRAATLAALQAGVTSDLAEVAMSRPIGKWSGWSSVEVERLASGYGTTYRYGANASMSRPLAPRVTVNAALSAFATTGDAPTLADGRSLYWSPELYVAPSVGVTYRLPLGAGWNAAGTVTPGWAFVRERATGEQRFGRGHQPTLGAAVELGYAAGDWNVLGTATWGGALDPSGYRASTVRIQGAYRLGEP